MLFLALPPSGTAQNGALPSGQDQQLGWLLLGGCQVIPSPTPKDLPKNSTPALVHSTGADVPPWEPKYKCAPGIHHQDGSPVNAASSLVEMELTHHSSSIPSQDPHTMGSGGLAHDDGKYRRTAPGIPGNCVAWFRSYGQVVGSYCQLAIRQPFSCWVSTVDFGVR